jgi:hypothetical protein
VLEELVSHKIDAVSCNFGPFCINQLIPLLSEQSISVSELSAGRYIYKIKNSRVDSFLTNEKPAQLPEFEIGEEKVDRNDILAYSAAAGYFIQGSNKNPVKIPMLTGLAEEFSQKQLFQKAGWAVLVLLISVLGINYFFFNHYFSKKAQLDAIADSEKSSIDKYDTLKTAFFEKRKFLTKTGMLDNPKTSYYADRIAQSIPMEITLSEVNINPLMKSNSADNSDMAFTTGIIDVLGVCKNSLDLENWIKTMQKYAWVKVINVLNYIHDREINEGKFSVEIQTR